jgi:hypothetical protein
MNIGQPTLPTIFPIHQTWDLLASNAIYQPLTTTIPAVTTTNGTYVFSGTESTTSVVDIFCGQFLSEPLKAQEISGTISGLWSARMTALDYGMGTQLHVRVLNNDLTDVRWVVYQQHTFTATTSTAGAVDRGFAVGTQRETRFLPGGGGNLISGWAWRGDRILVEMGVRATNTTATSRATDPRLQLRTDFADATYAEGTVGTTFNHWLEFSTNLQFDPNYAPATQQGWGVPIG